MAIEIVAETPTGLANLTVGDLREALRGVNPAALVVLARDAEENQYHPLMIIRKGEGTVGSGLYFRSSQYDAAILDANSGDPIAAGDAPAVLLVPAD